jgi:cell division topological specificity factor
VGFFERMFGTRSAQSSQQAKERLLTVLVHDRVKLTPDMMEQMKAELAAVIARYIGSVDPAEVEVTLLRGEAHDHLKADVPLPRSRG